MADTQRPSGFGIALSETAWSVQAPVEDSERTHRTTVRG
jgi:hypothetical protein